MSSPEYENWKILLRGRRLPAAVLDLDAFDRNADAVARAAAGSAGGKRIRIATKSIRVPDLIRRALKASPVYQGLMCFSPEEALFLADQGFDDLLVAYPSFQESDLGAFRKLIGDGKTVGAMVDSIEGIARLAGGLRNLPQKLPVWIDFDASLRLFGGLLHLGVRRSPVRTPAQALALAEAITAAPELRFGGIMAYEAQVAGLTDRNPFRRLMNPIAGIVRRQSSTAIARRRTELSAAFHAKGIPIPNFNGGGTGSLDTTVREEVVTEVTAGSAFFSPHLFDYYSNVRFSPALFFALQAVRTSDPGWITCQGGGYVASGTPGWDKVPRPWWPRGARLLPDEAAGEVQTPLRLPRGTSVQIGEPVFFRHAKAGELCERFEEILLFSRGQPVGAARTYRGLGKCFL